jgi:ribosomal protein L36
MIHITSRHISHYTCPLCSFFAVLRRDGTVYVVNHGNATHTGAGPWWIARAVRWMEARG